MSNPYITVEEIERKKIELGLNQPVLIQYIKWFLGLLQGNMGWSWISCLPFDDYAGSAVKNNLAGFQEKEGVKFCAVLLNDNQ